MSARTILILGLVLLAPRGAAPAVRIAELLGAVAFNDGFPAPARADVRIERRDGDVVHTTRGVLLARHHVVYVELEDGTRALVHAGKIVVATPHGPRRADAGAPLTGTDVLLEDLAPFTAGRLVVPQISDEGPTGVVVTGAPGKPSAYVLLVLTIEPERGTIVKTQYYRDAISELEKLRRDAGFVQVDGHWHPTEVTVDRLREKTSTRLTLTWSPAPGMPDDQFAPRALRGPSRLAAPPPHEPQPTHPG